ncbi:MAG: hypothetical protein GWP08_10745 [Nitrospiraceae bacterium]|nr:hypothetical protein [Nitrospiraceae bacterium]
MRRWSAVLTFGVIGLLGFSSNAAGYEYLIITHQDFYQAILPLADYREQNGLDTHVVTMAQISSRPTAFTIASYIESEYLEGLEQLKYVLLVGDVNFVPTHYVDAHDPAADGMIATDLYYATIGTADYLPDLYVGRLPVTTAAETTTMVNAIKAYKPLSKKVLLHGATAEMSYGYIHDTGILSPAGYIVETLAGAAASSSAVINRINGGKHIIAYYGHGSTTGMGNLYSSDITPTSLTNTELPIMLSGGCFNNEFDHATVRCIGEMLVLHPKGAIAFIGSTRTGGYGYAYKFLDGFYKALATKKTVGELLNAGRQEAYDAALAAGEPVGDGSWTKSFIEKINLLGDPALSIQFPAICFTAKVLGEHSKSTEALRGFRDSVLAPSPAGQEIIKLYYDCSALALRWLDAWTK